MNASEKRTDGVRTSPKAPPDHDKLVAALRPIVDAAKASIISLDAVLNENISFLPKSSQVEVNNRLALNDATSLHLAVLSGMSAATLLRMFFLSKDANESDGAIWTRAILAAVGMTNLEDEALRQLAFELFICALSNADDDGRPALSLAQFCTLQQDGRAFLRLH